MAKQLKSLLYKVLGGTAIVGVPTGAALGFYYGYGIRDVVGDKYREPIGPGERFFDEKIADPSSTYTYSALMTSGVQVGSDVTNVSKDLSEVTFLNNMGDTTGIKNMIQQKAVIDPTAVSNYREAVKRVTIDFSINDISKIGEVFAKANIEINDFFEATKDEPAKDKGEYGIYISKNINSRQNVVAIYKLRQIKDDLEIETSAAALDKYVTEMTNMFAPAFSSFKGEGPNNWPEMFSAQLSFYGNTSAIESEPGKIPYFSLSVNPSEEDSILLNDPNTTVLAANAKLLELQKKSSLFKDNGTTFSLSPITTEFPKDRILLYGPLRVKKNLVSDLQLPQEWADKGIYPTVQPIMDYSTGVFKLIIKWNILDITNPNSYMDDTGFSTLAVNPKYVITKVISSNRPLGNSDKTIFGTDFAVDSPWEVSPKDATEAVPAKLKDSLDPKWTTAYDEFRRLITGMRFNSVDNDTLVEVPDTGDNYKYAGAMEHYLSTPVVKPGLGLLGTFLPSLKVPLEKLVEVGDLMYSKDADQKYGSDIMTNTFIQKIFDQLAESDIVNAQSFYEKMVIEFSQQEIDSRPAGGPSFDLATIPALIEFDPQNGGQYRLFNITSGWYAITEMIETEVLRVHPTLKIK